MRRPWQVPFRRNRKLQSCLALSLALHLLVLFGITHREQVRSLSRAPADHGEVYQTAATAAHAHPARTAPANGPWCAARLSKRPRSWRCGRLRRHRGRLPVLQTSALRLPVAALPDRLVLPVPDFPARHIGPQLRAGALEGTRQGADEIDLSLELMDVQALDTGRHRAMVVVDPKDRRQLKGFFYMSNVYSPSIDRAESEISRRLYPDAPTGGKADAARVGR